MPCKLTAFLAALCCVFAFGQGRKGNFYITSGAKSHLLYIAFEDNASASGAALAEFERLSSNYNLALTKAIAIPDEKLDAMELAAERSTGSGASVAKLRNIYQITVPGASNEKLVSLAGELEKLPVISYCSLIPAEPIKPPGDIAPATPVYDNLQGYIGTQGVNIQYAWDMGFTGQGIRIRDVEYGFNKFHEELNTRNVNIAGGMLVSPEAQSDYTEHGTAVLGMMYADKGSYGITGMAYGADEALLFPEWQPDGYNRVNAISQAIAASKGGDILVFEMQACGPTGAFCPAEYENLVWDLTKAATDAGIVVIAAAGNGKQNLDSTGYSSYMSRGDSGAIIVGAGSNDAIHSRLEFSTYGKRVDVQGWGQGVYTTGYGDVAAIGGDFNQCYTNFSGTSSATPIVASCAVVLQSYYHCFTGGYLTSTELRDLMKETGTPQFFSSENIGPLPNMPRAINAVVDMLGVEAPQAGAFIAYPNPVADTLSLVIPQFGDAAVEVYNAVGQTVYTGTASGNTNIDMGSMASGFYTVKVTLNGKSSVKKIVKQ